MGCSQVVVHCAHRTRPFSGRAFGEEEGRPGCALILPPPYLTLRPIPQPFNIPLVLDRNESAHGEGEEHERYGWMDQRSDDGKEAKGRQRTAGGVAPDRNGRNPGQQQQESN